jgi:hypothetical protein
MCNKQKKKGTSSAKFTLDLAINENNDDEEHLKLPTTTLGKNTKINKNRLMTSLF